MRSKEFKVLNVLKDFKDIKDITISSPYSLLLISLLLTIMPIKKNHTCDRNKSNVR